jgi:hypothetical protein
MTISQRILLRMRNDSDESCRKNRNTRCMFTNFFFTVPFMRQCGKRCRAGQAADDSIIRHMHNTCWITKATDTHSEYVILTAILQQQWLRECTSICHTHTQPVLLHHCFDLSWPVMANWDKTVRLTSWFSPTLHGADHSQFSQAAFFSEVNSYCDLHNDPPPTSYHFIYLMLPKSVCIY